MSDAAPTTERLAVEPLPERPRRPALSAVPPAGLAAAVAAAEAQAAQPAPQPVYVTQKPAPADLLRAAFAGIARILAVRFQLLLSLIGAFVLATLAMQWQTPAGLYVLIAYCVLAVVPFVWLEHSGRPR